MKIIKTMIKKQETTNQLNIQGVIGGLSVIKTGMTLCWEVKYH